MAVEKSVAVLIVVILGAMLSFASIARASSAVGAFLPGDQIYGLGLVGDRGANEVDITLDSDSADPSAWRYSVVDTTGIRSIFGLCDRTGADTALCPVKGAVGLSLRDGDDHLALLGNFASHVVLGGGSDRVLGASGRDEVFGGPGKDRIDGRAGNDLIQGEFRPDHLQGRRGKDRLVGGSGRDRFLGGSGHDRLTADDGERDKLIDCGSGADVALVDNRDPRTLHCEQVMVR